MKKSQGMRLKLSSAPLSHSHGEKKWDILGASQEMLASEGKFWNLEGNSAFLYKKKVLKIVEDLWFVSQDFSPSPSHSFQCGN